MESLTRDVVNSWPLCPSKVGYQQFEDDRMSKYLRFCVCNNHAGRAVWPPSSQGPFRLVFSWILWYCHLLCAKIQTIMAMFYETQKI